MTWYPEMPDLDDLDPSPQGRYERERAIAGRRVCLPPRSRNVVLNKTWMGLKPNPDNPLVWEAVAERFFRPQGIISVATPTGALVHDFTIGNTRVLPMGIPVALETFTELDRVLGENSPARPSFPPMEVGTRLCIRVTAPDGKSPLVWPTSFTIWGVVPETF